MEQKCELKIDGTVENIKEVMDYLNVDRTQRSDNKNDLFVIFENSENEHSLCTGYSDVKFDSDLDVFYSDEKNNNSIAFKSYRKNLFKFGQFLSEKFLHCKFKLAWIERIEGVEHLFVLLVEKSCVIYYQHGMSYLIAPNLNTFVHENHLEKYIETHTRQENQKL